MGCRVGHTRSAHRNVRLAGVIACPQCQKLKHKSLNMKRLLIFATLQFVFSSTHSWADDAVSPEVVKLSAVEVTGKRTVFTSVSYQQFADQVRKVTKLSEGAIGVGILVEPTSSSVDLRGLAAFVEDDKQVISLPVLPGGVVRFLADPAINESSAVISFNREPGSLRTRAGVLFPIVDRSNLTIEKVNSVVEKGVFTIREIRPALLRWTAPSQLFFSVCQSEPNGEVTGEADGKVVQKFAMDKKTKDDGGRPVYCARFSASDALPGKLKLQVPTHAQLLLLE